MPKLVTDGDRQTIEIGSFRLVFSWTGSTWTHSLELPARVAKSRWVLALAIEGEPSRDDPSRVVSPAYQDLHFQEADGTIQALLVGQSGPHHFSAVFTAREGSEPVAGGDASSGLVSGASIGVDIADRCRSPVEFLASTYLLSAGSGELREATFDRLAWASEVGELALTPTPDAQASMAEAGRRLTQAQVIAKIQTGSATHRLAYRWTWRPDPSFD